MRLCLRAVCALLCALPTWVCAGPTPRVGATEFIDRPVLLQTLQSQALADRAKQQPKIDRALSSRVTSLKQGVVPKALRFPAEEDRDVSVDASGAIQVNIDFQTSASPAALAQLEARGFRLDVLSNTRQSAQGWVKPETIDALSRLPGIKHLRLPSYGVAQGQGSVVTQGDAALRFDRLRDLGMIGSGIRIGVISDGVESMASAQASGDLGFVSVLQGCTSGDYSDGICDEGTAMLEVLYDIAPGATLGFCGGQPGARSTSNLDFINCAQRLAGPEFQADIIVDDFLFATEPMLADGDADSVASVVKAITERGVIWVSAAGNNGSGALHRQFYSAEYIPMSLQDAAADGLYDSVNDFGFAATSNLAQNQQVHSSRNRLTVEPRKTVKIVLQWAGAFDGSTRDDYDLFVFAAGTDEVLASSTNIQDGNGNDNYPLEIVQYASTSKAQQDVDVVIARKKGSSIRRLKMFTCFQDSLACDLQYANQEGQIVGHPALPAVLSVGALDLRAAGLDVIEDYSSTGPASLNFPSYVERPKPDLVAVDRVAVTGAGGFPKAFGGTSAAAPHVAAMLALLKGLGGYPSKDIKQAALSSAVDLGTSGRDDIFGYGRVDGVLASIAASNQIPSPGTGSGAQPPDTGSNPDSGGSDSKSGAGSISPSLLCWFMLFALTTHRRRMR